MNVHLAYGKTGLDLPLPEDWNAEILSPRFVPALPDPQGALRQALMAPINSPPLHTLARPGDCVGIVFSDLTRPTPNHILLPPILDTLSFLPVDNITLFNALGTHRPNTDSELRQMLGDDIVNNYRIIQNDAFDPSSQVCLGVSSRGHEIWLNRQLVECDLKILTGFIEPHLFAGFSGGGKAILPGMAGQRTVLGNHDASMIAHPKSTWGILDGNLIQQEIKEVAQQIGRTFLVNITLNKDKAITAIFAGDLLSAHRKGCDFVKETAMVGVREAFDIVVTTNSGYPLDLNLYQSVKGMSAASQVIRRGGTIIAAADCWDGIPENSMYAQLVQQASSPQQLLDRISVPGFLEQDQWQAQIQAQIQLKADVYVYTKNLSPAQIEGALFKPCFSILETLSELRQKYGLKTRLCILPEGPQTIPYLQPIP